MSSIKLKYIIYAVMLLLSLIFVVFSVIRTRKTYKQEANQQRVYFKLFILSLTLYFFGGFLGGICVFHNTPLIAISRVIAFIDVPTYALCFLLMSVLYVLIILATAVLNFTQDDSIRDSLPEARGLRKPGRKIRGFLEVHPRLAYFLIYSVLFAIIFACVFSVNIYKGKGLIWRIDGESQYLPYMKYMSDYFKEMFSNFASGNFTIRMYDFSIGLGEDVRSVVRIHPTEFLSAFFNQDQLEGLYNFLMVFRYYIAGLTFALYCKYRGIAGRNTLVASYIYIFSGYGLNMASRHPIFNSPVIFFPLLLIAMDRLIKKKGSLFLSFMVAISLATSYYFLYMSTIALGVYALVRFFETYHEHRVKEFFAMMGKIISFYVIGAGMAAVFFLPTVIRALNSDRVGSAKSMFSSLLSYSDNQVAKLFASTVSGQCGCYDIYLHFAIIFLPALVILFVSEIRERLGLKIIVILECIAISLPAAGLAMSAFSAVTNRWIYIAAMTAAYLIAVTMDEFLEMNIVQFITLCAVTGLYLVTYLYFKINDNTIHLLDLKLSLILLVVTVFILLFIKSTQYITKNELAMAMLLLTVVSLTAHGCYLFGNSSSEYSNEYLTTGEEADEFLNKNEFSRLGNINDNSFYRCDVATTRDYYENMPLVFGYNGTSIYNSIINSGVVNYMVDLDSIGISAVHRIYNLDGRTALEELGCVKYYQVAAGKNLGIPYGFVRNEELSTDEFWVYENQNPLSIGYTYKNWISTSKYEELSTLDKQQAMLNYAVLDSDECGLSNSATEVKTGEVLERSPKLSKPDKQLTSENNYFQTITAEGNQGFMMSYNKLAKDDTPGFSITFHRKKGYEIYLKLEDFETTAKRAKVLVENDRFSKMVILRNATGTYSLDRNDYYVNIGYSQGYGDDTLRLKFCDSADYSLKDIKLYYVPMDTYKQSVADLSADSLTNVSIDENTVTGNVNATQNEIMVFSIPYSDGWTATVDGVKTKLFHANDAYMGISLSAGNHEVKLSYETPGLKIGGCISVVALLLFCFIGFLGGIIGMIKKIGGKEEY